MTEVSPAAHTQTAFDPFLRHSSHTSYTAMSAPYFGRDHQRHLSRHDSNHHHSSPQTSSPRNSRQNSGSSFTLPPISALLDGIRPSHPAADAPSSYPPHGETQNYSTACSSRRDYSDNRIPRSNLLNLHPPAGLNHTSSYPEPPPPPPRTSRSSVDSTDYPPIASPSHHRQSWQSQTSQGGSAAPVYPPSPDSRTIADAAYWQSSSSLPPLGHPAASLSGAPLSTSPTASFVNVSPLSTKSQWQSHQHSHPHPYFTPAGTGSSSSSGPTHPQSISTSSSSQGQAQQQHDRYVCPTCSKAFSRPSSLRIHSHSHTGHKPFRCPRTGCGKAFSVRSNMKRHERGCHIDGVAGANKVPSSTDHDGDADMGETGSEEEA